MRIAFVGKGGSGKTTTSSLFAQYQSKVAPTLAIDADINMHMAELLGGARPMKDQLISEKGPSEEVRTYLRGVNSLIETNAHFKKSTPPGKGSNLVDITDPDNPLIHAFTQRITDTLRLMTVGSYSEEGVASSCYHNNLSVLENILTHTIDRGTLVVDMVAGTDAFASTLFAQFDVLVFVVEPTTRSVAVYEQYERLARHAGVADKLYVIANKIEDDDDNAFITSTIGAGKIVGSLLRSEHLLRVDKGRSALDFDKLDAADQVVFENVASLLRQNAVSSQERLPRLWELHKTYVRQGFVKDRFGDLTTQIDQAFTYPEN